MNFKPSTDFLFSRPTFWVGVGSAFNMWGNYFAYNASKSAQEADRRAIACDIAVVKEAFMKAKVEAIIEAEKRLNA